MTPCTLLPTQRSPHPFSIYYGSGTSAWNDPHICESFRRTDLLTYWDPWEIAEAAQANLFLGDYEEVVIELEHLLKDAIQLRLLSDVPLGAFLWWN